jgi:hypothetical protein
MCGAPIAHLTVDKKGDKQNGVGFDCQAQVCASCAMAINCQGSTSQTGDLAKSDFKGEKLEKNGLTYRITGALGRIMYPSLDSG